MPPRTSTANRPTRRLATRELISIAEAAERLSVGNQTVRDLISRGRLPGYRIGDRLLRVDAADVDALIRPVPVTRGGAA